jgi:hypothetical protein
LALYVNNEQVFVPWDYKNMDVKYLLCVFESIYALDVINMLEDLLYQGIPKELHIYDTHDYLNRI